MLKSVSILEKMHPDDLIYLHLILSTNFKNRADNLHLICLADFASSYVSKREDDLPLEPDKIKS